MKKKLIIVSSLVVCLVGGFIFYKSLVKNNDFNASGFIISDGVIPGYTAEQIQEMMQQKADKSMFSFEINSRPTFENGDAEGAIRIANPPYGAYNIQVTMTLDDTGEKLFESGVLKPNQYIEKAKLLKRLVKGTYEATATINAYDMETEEFVGTSAAKLIIEIKE